MSRLLRLLSLSSLYSYILLFALFSCFPSASWASASSSRRSPRAMHRGLADQAQISNGHGATQLSVRGFSTHIDNAARFSTNQVLSIQITACVLAAISLSASLIAVSWFWRMRQKFRHRLIMLLVYADVMRSFWLFVFPVVTFARGPVQTSSKFCQASGFLTQMALEMADISILFIAIHTALQVFKPPLSRSGIEEGGLYKYRYIVYAVFVCLPPLLASLAFVRSLTAAYESDGPFCALPIRPFWYRLAISWIPRYIIMLTVAGLYIAIYVHVIVEFRVIGWLRQNTGSSGTNETTLLSLTSAGDGTLDTISPVESVRRDPQWPSTLAQRQSSSAVAGTLQTKSSNSRKASSVAKRSDSANGQDSFDLKSALQTSPTTSNRNHNQTGLPILGDGCVDHLAESRFHEFQRSSKNPQSISADEKIRNAETAQKGKNKEMRERHTAIQRQLRYLFIYPVCYFLIWMIPFVVHLMNYSNYFAQHPVFVLSLLSTACLSAMGTVDYLVFTLREKPWRSIPGTNGTFLGSFACWSLPPPPSKATPTEAPKEKQHINLRSTQHLESGDSNSQVPLSAVSPDSGEAEPKSLQLGLDTEPAQAPGQTKPLDERGRSERNRDRYWFDTSKDVT